MGNIMEYGTGWKLKQRKTIDMMENLKSTCNLWSPRSSGEYVWVCAKLVLLCNLWNIFWLKENDTVSLPHARYGNKVYDNDATAWCCFVKRYVSVCLDIDLSTMNPPPLEDLSRRSCIEIWGTVQRNLLCYEKIWKVNWQVCLLLRCSILA